MLLSFIPSPLLLFARFFFTFFHHPFIPTPFSLHSSSLPSSFSWYVFSSLSSFHHSTPSSASTSLPYSCPFSPFPASPSSFSFSSSPHSSYTLLPFHLPVPPSPYLRLFFFLLHYYFSLSLLPYECEKLNHISSFKQLVQALPLFFIRPSGFSGLIRKLFSFSL